MKILLVVVALLTAACTQAPGAPTPATAQLTIQVIDVVTGQPLAATIRVADASANTNSSGYATLTVPTEVVITLSMEAPGYLTRSEPLRLHSATSETTFSLTPAP